jgi:hypothetical protein
MGFTVIPTKDSAVAAIKIVVIGMDIDLSIDIICLSNIFGLGSANTLFS